MTVANPFDPIAEGALAGASDSSTSAPFNPLDGVAENALAASTGADPVGAGMPVALPDPSSASPMPADPGMAGGGPLVSRLVASALLTSTPPRPNGTSPNGLADARAKVDAANAQAAQARRRARAAARAVAAKQAAVAQSAAGLQGWRAATAGAIGANRTALDGFSGPRAQKITGMRSDLQDEADRLRSLNETLDPDDPDDAAALDQFRQDYGTHADDLNALIGDTQTQAQAKVGRVQGQIDAFRREDAARLAGHNALVADLNATARAARARFAEAQRSADGARALAADFDRRMNGPEGVMDSLRQQRDHYQNVATHALPGQGDAEASQAVAHLQGLLNGLSAHPELAPLLRQRGELGPNPSPDLDAQIARLAPGSTMGAYRDSLRPYPIPGLTPAQRQERDARLGLERGRHAASDDLRAQRIPQETALLKTLQAESDRIAAGGTTGLGPQADYRHAYQVQQRLRQAKDDLHVDKRLPPIPSPDLTPGEEESLHAGEGSPLQPLADWAQRSGAAALGFVRNVATSLSDGDSGLGPSDEDRRAATHDLLPSFRDGITQPLLTAPKALVHTASNALSGANGPIDPSIYHDDGASRFFDKTVDYVPYLIPGVNAAYGAAQLSDLGASLASDPKGTLKGLGRSINFLEPGILPEDRFFRAVNLAGLVLGGARAKGEITDAVAVRTLVREHGMDPATAREAVAAARGQMADMAGGVAAERVARAGDPSVIRSRPAQAWADLVDTAKVGGAVARQTLLRPGSVGDVLDAATASRLTGTYGLSPLEAGLLVKASRAQLEAEGAGTALGSDDGVRSEFRADSRDVAARANDVAAGVMRSRNGVIGNGPVDAAVGSAGGGGSLFRADKPGGARWSRPSPDAPTLFSGGNGSPRDGLGPSNPPSVPALSSPQAKGDARPRDRDPRVAFRAALESAVGHGIATLSQARGAMDLMDARAARWARENGSTADEFYRRWAPSFVYGRPVPEGALHQVEGLLSGKEAIGRPDTPSGPADERARQRWLRSQAASAIQDYAAKNPVFDRPVSQLSDEEFVRGIVEHTVRELTAFRRLKDQEGDPGREFYGEDVLERANPMLIDWAKQVHGRELTPGEVRLYHLVSTLASPGRSPEFESRLGLKIFDRYLRTGEISGYGDKQSVVWKRNAQGRKVRTDQLRFEPDGITPRPSRVSETYDLAALRKVNALIGKLGVEGAMEWLGSRHSHQEMVDTVGLNPNRAEHEYLTKAHGGFGVFGVTGPKLGSYALNRWGHFGTITKDMWFARTLARLSGEPLLTKGGQAIDKPWGSSGVGLRKRRLVDEAWRRVAKVAGTNPATIQGFMWDLEQTLYGKLGMPRSTTYVSDGLKRGIADVEAGNLFGTLVPGLQRRSRADAGGIRETNERSSGGDRGGAPGGALRPDEAGPDAGGVRSDGRNQPQRGDAETGDVLGAHLSGLRQRPRADAGGIRETNERSSGGDRGGAPGGALRPDEAGDEPGGADGLLQSESGVTKGAVVFSPGERPVVHLFTGISDVSTLLHELGHVFRRTIPDAENAVVERHFGPLGTRASEEGFARAFERYLRNGKAPTPELGRAFRGFKYWLAKIYHHIKGSPLEAKVHPEIRALFDRMLGGGAPPSSADDPYAGKPLRTGTTPAQAELGRQGMDDLRTASGSSALARGVARDLGRGGASDLVGKPIGSPEDLAALAQVLRSGRHEVARFVFTKGGRVVALHSGTLRLPGMASFATRENGGDVGGWVGSRMKELGADGVWLLHNHPSGDPTPSAQDLALTERLAGRLPGFRGHVVIDSDRFAHVGIDPRGQAVASVHDLPPGLASPPGRALPVLGAPARSVGELLRVAQTSKSQGGMGTLIATTPQGRVGRVAEVGLGDVLRALGEEGPRSAAALRRFALGARSASVHLVLPKGAAESILAEPRLRAGLRLALGKNLLADAVTHDGRSLREAMGMPKDGRYALGRRLSDAERAYAVREPLGEPDEAPSILLPNGQKLIRNATDRIRLQSLRDELGHDAGTARFVQERTAPQTDLTPVSGHEMSESGHAALSRHLDSLRTARAAMDQSTIRNASDVGRREARERLDREIAFVEERLRYAHVERKGPVRIKPLGVPPSGKGKLLLGPNGKPLDGEKTLAETNRGRPANPNRKLVAPDYEAAARTKAGDPELRAYAPLETNAPDVQAVIQEVAQEPVQKELAWRRKTRKGEVRELAMNWIQARQKTEPMYTPVLGTDVFFSRETFEKLGMSDITGLRMVPLIPELLSKARLVHNTAGRDLAKTGMTGTWLVARLSTVQDGNYNVFMFIRRMHNGDFYYDHGYRETVKAWPSSTPIPKR